MKKAIKELARMERRNNLSNAIGLSLVIGTFFLSATLSVNSVIKNTRNKGCRD